MSLYSMIFGVKPAALLVLPMLGKHPDEYPRFRDCFLSDPDYPQFNDHIHIYTRVGGGNRDDYEAEIDKLRSMKGYITDHDDSFDSTYATFVFKVPKEWKSDFEKFKRDDFAGFSVAYKQHLLRIFPRLAGQLKELFS